MLQSFSKVLTPSLKSMLRVMVHLQSQHLGRETGRWRKSAITEASQKVGRVLNHTVGGAEAHLQSSANLGAVWLPPDTGWPSPFLTNDFSSNRDSHELNLVSAVNSTSQFVQTESKLTILKSSQDSCTLIAGSGNRGSLSKLARLTKLASSEHQWGPCLNIWGGEWLRSSRVSPGPPQADAHTCAHTSTNKHT